VIPHILIRTYEKDRDWLVYCLKSIKKHNPEIGVTVVAPEGHDVGYPTTHVQPVHQDGYIDQQYTKLRAVAYVPEDATHVIHIDSDCLVIGDLMDTFIDGKPIMLKTPWELVGGGKIWREPTRKYLGFDPKFEYMRRMPLVYPTRIYNDLTIHLEKIHGPIGSWFHNVQRLSEFNLLGAYADRFMPEEFHWIDTSKEPLPPLVVKQGWSWGGFAAMKDEWDALYSEPPLEHSSTIVLSAGESMRFDGPYPKQHIEIDGERIIDRTLRMFPDAHLIAINPEIANHPKVFKPKAHRYTSETLLSTKELWKDVTTVLFGDVYYTDEAVEIIKKSTPTTFFTDGQDIFGLKFDQDVSGFLREVVAKADQPDGNCGRIWEVYRLMFGLPNWPATSDMPALTFIGDKTQDFDTVEDLENFKNGISKNLIYAKSRS